VKPSVRILDNDAIRRVTEVELSRLIGPNRVAAYRNASGEVFRVNAVSVIAGNNIAVGDCDVGVSI